MPSLLDRLPQVLDRSAPVRRLISLFAKGCSLPEHIWLRRHQALLTVLWFHVIGIGWLALARGYGTVDSAAGAGILGVAASIASLHRPSREWRATMVALGLLSSSALLVHLTGGLIESHFHFFVVVALLTAYSDWSIFLVAIGYVAIHHGVFGVLEPEAVFSHAVAWRAPWKWALIHAAYVLAASAAALVACRWTEERALRDSLTELSNAESFLEQANRSLARVARRGGHVGILYLDLDDFKSVNDTLGHAAGDQLLIGIGRRLRGALRESDIAARLGGDEFAVLLEDIDALGEAERVASRVLHELDQPIKVKDRELSISASVGVAVTGTHDHRTPQILLNDADEAMYKAKQSGKGRYQASPRADGSSSERSGASAI